MMLLIKPTLRNALGALLLLLAVSVFAVSARAQWTPLGPDGGDVRSLTYDPANPDRIYLGTSAGRLYLSTDNGSSWSRFARLGGGYDFVLDNMEIDPRTGTMYVAAWDANIERENGDLFRSTDGGKSWQTLPAMHGKSIRAMMLAPSDPRIVIVGALDGVFRSRDGGNTFEQISPPGHREIKNIESVAVDPNDPGVIYAGTWHLAWKTSDGGRNWHSIKQGVIDDSDVFSIIVDSSNAHNVYLSACSGIYKSENAAELFHKVQGIPFSARRTRVLKQDPVSPATVYAGTTEGLWVTNDAGKAWRRITAPNVIVNDIHIDPRRPARVLVATDRGGVLASNDAGRTFFASNRGFAHRYVSSVVVDRGDPRTLYAGLMNDKEFGGVFVSRDGGITWAQLSAGLGGYDVFTLAQSESGALLAGTNHGMFLLEKGAPLWRPANTVVTEKIPPAPKPVRGQRARKPAGPQVQLLKSELHAVINQLQARPHRWFAATSAGLYQSTDAGRTWRGGPVEGEVAFHSVGGSGELVLVTSSRAALLSRDDGKSWTPLALPDYLTGVHGGAIAGKNVLWLATREGALRSDDGGATWTHVLEGLPARHIQRIEYQPQTGRLFAIAADGDLFVSRDQGQSWQRQESGYAVRSLTFSPSRILAATTFDGVISESAPEAAVTAVGSTGGGQR
jgi:photosystem II stability/assembly factor-like uncharacterized protein